MENLDKKNLRIRTIAGIVYIAILLLGIFGGEYVFMSVFGLIMITALYEFYRLMENKISYSVNKEFNIFFGLIIFLSVFLLKENEILYILIGIILIYLLSLFILGILLNKNNILLAIIYSIFGQIYITLPFCLLIFLTEQSNGTQMMMSSQNILILGIFVFLWVNDSFAFLVGSLFGKHKLSKRISPKKSIEGLIGGIIFTLFAALLFYHIEPSYPVYFWIGFALVVTIFGTIGDLFESLIKRTYGVKDAGHIIPGHGGILDRIDSLLIAIPAVYVYFMTFTILYTLF